MQVGAAEGRDRAIAVIGVSQALDVTTLAALSAIEAVDKVLQVNFGA
jgi:hypothetical protein